MHESRLVKMTMATSADVAQSGFEAMMKGKTVVITGAMNYVLANSVRFAPRSIVTRLSRFISDRTGARQEPS